MMIKIKVASAWVTIFAIAFLSATEKVFASPALSTGWVTVNGDKAECLRRAVGTISTERKGGKLSQSGSSVYWNNEVDNVIVSCVSISGGKSIAFISVATDEASASRLRDVIYDGIKKGGPYE